MKGIEGEEKRGLEQWLYKNASCKEAGKAEGILYCLLGCT